MDWTTWMHTRKSENFLQYAVGGQQNVLHQPGLSAYEWFILNKHTKVWRKDKHGVWRWAASSSKTEDWEWCLVDVRPHSANERQLWLQTTEREER